jgi:signal transduction histidine kinase
MGKIKCFLRNRSVRFVFVLYLLTYLIAATILIGITLDILESLRWDIMLSYSGIDPYTYDWSVPLDYSPQARTANILINVANMFFFVLYYGGGSILFSFLFYRTKLKPPIEVLSQASQKISSNKLDFHVEYDSKDEFGKLCKSFESMRASLEDIHRSLWRSIEERQRINAAFAHDLRTPLTVLRGYADFLLQYIPQDKVNKEKVLETISTMSGHIARLEDYVEHMNALQKLEQIRVQPKLVLVSETIAQWLATAQWLAKSNGLEIQLKNDLSVSQLRIDPSVVTRVLENLVANGVRYARHWMVLRFWAEEGFFCVQVSDDGEGFSKEGLRQAAEPFYRESRQQDSNHFGLGLNICKALCEKHGGSLSLDNGREGGGEVTARFRLESFG